jgi:hypothetical protein
VNIRECGIAAAKSRQASSAVLKHLQYLASLWACMKSSQRIPASQPAETTRLFMASFPSHFGRSDTAPSVHHRALCRGDVGDHIVQDAAEEAMGQCDSFVSMWLGSFKGSLALSKKNRSQLLAIPGCREPLRPSEPRETKERGKTNQDEHEKVAQPSRTQGVRQGRCSSVIGPRTPSSAILHVAVVFLQ